MKIRNTTKGPIGLSFECVVAEGQTLDVSAEAFAEFAKSEVVAAYFEKGMLVEVDVSAEEAAAAEAAAAEAAAAAAEATKTKAAASK